MLRKSGDWKRILEEYTEALEGEVNDVEWMLNWLTSLRELNVEEGTEEGCEESSVEEGC